MAKMMGEVILYLPSTINCLGNSVEIFPGEGDIAVGGGVFLIKLGWRSILLDDDNNDDGMTV